MEFKVTDRPTLKLIASGKYLEMNKSAYDQDKHQAFIEGALFVYDYITAANKKKESANDTANSKTDSV